jgi:hypothetical protein
MKKCIFMILWLLIILILPLPLHAQGHQGQKAISKKDMASASGTEQAKAYSPMPDPGKKVPIGSGYYLIYGFDKKPKLGTLIMKVEIFTEEGAKDTSFEVKADAGMPSMKGAHETGDRTFKLSKRRDYLLPISIVMPGDWEIRLTVLKDGKIIFSGKYNFDV